MPQGSGRHPDANITNATPGEPLRVEVDSGDANRQEVRVEVRVKDAAGGTTVWFAETVFVGDTPVEWQGPTLPLNLRDKLLRVRVSDPITGQAIADDIIRIN